MAEHLPLFDRGDPHLQLHNKERETINGILDRLDILETNPTSPGVPENIMARLLPEDGSLGMKLQRNADPSQLGMWIEEPPMGSYRDTWAPDTELYYQDFSGGVVPPEFGIYDPGALATAALTVESMATNGGGDKPSSVNALRINTGARPNTGGQRIGGVLNTANLPDLAGKTLTRVVFYEAVRINVLSGNKLAEFMENGLVRKVLGSPSVADATTTWEKHSVPLSSGMGPVQWQIRAQGSSTSNNYIYLAAVQIFGTLEPYNRKDVVDHLGKYYRSQIDNNSDEPGTSESWLELP